MKKKTVFASDLGWAPGYWPTSANYLGELYKLSRYERDGDGDLMYVVYRNFYKQTETLIVYND